MDEIIIQSVSTCQASSSAIVDNNGKQEIYMWGYNGFGQLGLGDTTSRLVPTLLDPSKLGNYNFIKELIFDYQYGSYITCIIVDTNNGEQIYVFGQNDYGQLGIGNTANQLNPVLLDTTIFGEFTQIKELKFNPFSQSSYIILETISGKDKIFVWGANNVGQLGIGNNQNQLLPIALDLNIFGEYTNLRDFTIKYIGHVIVDMNDGSSKLYTWGNNYKGWLGLGHNNNVSSPTEVKSSTWINKRIKFVFCTGYGTIAILTSNGIDEWYGWGEGTEYNLSGPGLGSGSYSTPQKANLSLLGNPTEILGINGHSTIYVSVKINGQIAYYAWGNNMVGTVGDGTTQTRTTPYRITNSALGNCTEVYDSIFDGYGKYSYTPYAYVKTPNGDKLYVWSSTTAGQFGLSGLTRPTSVDSLDLSTFKIINLDKINIRYNLIISLKDKNTSTMENYASGNNNYGQLGVASTNNVAGFKKVLPARATNPISKIITSNLTAVEVLNLINPNNVLDTIELEKYVDTTSFPASSTLSIDITKTISNLEQGILNLAITTNKYNNPLVIDTITTPKTFEVAINGLQKATNINTNPIFVRETLFPNQDKITIKELYDTICNSAGKVINRQLLEQYLDLTSIPPTAELYLLPNSLDDPINATFTLKSNEVYLSGITTVQEYSQQDLTISLEEIMNWVLIISLSVVGGVLLIAALVGFMLVKRNSNRIII